MDTQHLALEFVERQRFAADMRGLCRRAALDADFRALCLADAQAAYEGYTGHPARYPLPVFFDTDGESAGGMRLPGYLAPTWLG